MSLKVYDHIFSSAYFIYEVEVDVVPLDVCGVVFGIPYMHEGCDIHDERKMVPLDQGWEVFHH
jgi:hypothetical protein